MTDFTLTQRLLAWSVHLFTASGILAGFMAILAINAADWRTAMLWLFACQIIDGADGTLARLFRVSDVLPRVSGKNIDFVIDFATYAIIPAYFFYHAGLAPDGWELAGAFVILFVSAIYYGLDGMVSYDMYFVGFPVMWNMVIFFLVFVFQLPPWGNLSLVFALAMLHFVPIKFAYPSRATRLRGLTLTVAVLFLAGMAATVWIFPDRNILLTVSSIAAAAYFGGLAVWDTYFR